MDGPGPRSLQGLKLTGRFAPAIIASQGFNSYCSEADGSQAKAAHNS